MSFQGNRWLYWDVCGRDHLSDIKARSRCFVFMTGAAVPALAHFARRLPDSYKALIKSWGNSSELLRLLLLILPYGETLMDERETEGFRGSLPGLCLAADDSVTSTGAWQEEQAAAPADWKRNVVKGVVAQAASGRFSPFTPDLMKIVDTRQPVQPCVASRTTSRPVAAGTGRLLPMFWSQFDRFPAKKTVWSRIIFSFSCSDRPRLYNSPLKKGQFTQITPKSIKHPFHSLTHLKTHSTHQFEYKDS